MKKMPTYLLANWKANINVGDAKKWLVTFAKYHRPHPDIEVIIAPPALYLESFKKLIIKMELRKVSLACQDLSPWPMGSYTGALPADVLKEFVDYAIVGHSERRRYFHESDLEIANKVSEAQASGVTPILCVDLPYAHRQFVALDSASLDDKMIIGYGPVGAIGLDIDPEMAEVQEAVSAIQEMLPSHPILYGGSVNTKNALSYLEINKISGVMVASGALNPLSFVKICDIVAKSLSANRV